MPLKPCLDKVSELNPQMRDAINSYLDKHLKKGLSERQAEIRAVEDYAKKINGELNSIRKKVGLSSNEYIPHNPKEKIAEIEKKYAEQAAQNTIPTEEKSTPNVEPNKAIPTTEEAKGAEPPVTEPPVEHITVDENDPELTKMANAVNDAFVKGKFGAKAMDDIISKLQDTDLKNVYNNVKAKIEKGIIDLNKLRERILTTKTGSESDQAALLYDLAELKNKEQSITKEINLETDTEKVKELQKQLMEVQNQMMDNALANRYIGRSASTLFRLRQLWVNKDKTLVDFVDEYKAANNIKELTPEQEQHIKERFNIIQEAKAKLKSAKAELDKAMEEKARLEAENEKLNKLKGSRKADRKIRTEEELKKSNERIQKSKDKLKGLIDDTKKVGISPKSQPFLAPKMVAAISEIAGEKVYQGVVKFDQLVHDILDEIKDVLPNWTEKDVINHLLSTKDKDGNYISSLSSKKYIESKKLSGTSNENLREKIRAYEKAQKDVAIKQFEWQRDMRMDMMKNMPVKDRIIDSILRWQRFAVLSYPSTFVKLIGVVLHQLVMKPFKFGVQALTSGLTKVASKDISSKQTVWGTPQWSSLAKYYSEFIRNFALSNLKEHFAGIDTKELLYGNNMVYDEFNAAKGLLDMPGRSHGYIKSFIKSPEFKFAHEQMVSSNLKKMKNIQEKLSDKNLSELEKEKLKKEYEDYDITNEDVIERINKLALEHGKWSILMNDNQFVKKFQQWTRDNGITGALIKSELPIVKIPTNYIGRYFALKYGLIRSIIGKNKWEGKENNFPGIAQLVIKGSKDLTEDQANLLGKSLATGTFGAAMFGLGYMLQNKVRKNDDGSVNVGDVHISKTLTHSPEMESFLSGTDMGKEKNGNKKWVKNFFENDVDVVSKNPFLTSLQYGFLPNMGGALLNFVKGKNAGDVPQLEQKTIDAVGKKVSDMTIPGFIKQPAQWLDTKEKGLHPMGEPIKRKPDSKEVAERFWQNLEMNIPGLRQNVPASKSQLGTFIVKDAKKKIKREATKEEFEQFQNKRDALTEQRIKAIPQTTFYIDRYGDVHTDKQKQSRVIKGSQLSEKQLETIKKAIHDKTSREVKRKLFGVDNE